MCDKVNITDLLGFILNDETYLKDRSRFLFGLVNNK